MSEVKRYFIPGIEFLYDEEPTPGEFVELRLAADCAALEPECERLKRENADIRAKWTELEAERDAIRAELAALKAKLQVAERFAPKIIKCMGCGEYHADGYLCACGSGDDE